MVYLKQESNQIPPSFNSGDIKTSLALKGKNVHHPGKCHFVMVPMEPLKQNNISFFLASAHGGIYRDNPSQTRNLLVKLSTAGLEDGSLQETAKGHS